MAQITKRAIADSFLHQLESKPMQKITITNIADDCGINRMTFYYYFQDVYDLLRWVIREQVENTFRESDRPWEESFLLLCRNAVERKSVVLNMFRSVRMDRIQNDFNGLIYEYLISWINRVYGDTGMPKEDREAVARFYMHAIVGMELDWIEDGMKESPETLVRRISILMEDRMSQTVNSFRQAGVGDRKEV